jgi:hypothetical protein
MSSMGSRPRLIRTLATCMTYHDSHSASAAQPSADLSTLVQALSSSTDRSCLLRGCRPHSSASTSIASRTSKYVSYR